MNYFLQAGGSYFFRQIRVKSIFPVQSNSAEHLRGSFRTFPEMAAANCRLSDAPGHGIFYTGSFYPDLYMEHPPVCHRAFRGYLNLSKEQYNRLRIFPGRWIFSWWYTITPEWEKSSCGAGGSDGFFDKMSRLHWLTKRTCCAILLSCYCVIRRKVFLWASVLIQQRRFTLIWVLMSKPHSSGWIIFR